MLKRKQVSKTSSKELVDNPLNDLTEKEQEILSNTLNTIIEKETTLIHSVLQSKLNEVKKIEGGLEDDSRNF